MVWVGRDDNAATPLTGSTGALPIWADLMSQLPTRGVNLQPPEGVNFDWLDRRTGHLSAEGCEGAIWVPLKTDYAPTESVPCRLEQRERSWWDRFWN